MPANFAGLPGVSSGRSLNPLITSLWPIGTYLGGVIKEGFWLYACLNYLPIQSSQYCKEKMFLGCQITSFVTLNKNLLAISIVGLFPRDVLPSCVCQWYFPYWKNPAILKHCLEKKVGKTKYIYLFSTFTNRIKLQLLRMAWYTGLIP